MNRDAFYSKEERRKSRELDFGVWWRDGVYHPQYRVTYLPGTRELICVNQFSDDYQILGRIVSEERAEEILKGWAEICGEINSLDWVRNRLADGGAV